MGHRGTARRLAACVLLLAGCTAQPRNSDGTPALLYRPTDAILADQGVAALGRLDALRVTAHELVVARYPYPHLFSTRFPTRYELGRARIALAYPADMDPAAPTAFDYASLGEIGVVQDYGFRGVTLSGGWYLWCNAADGGRREACVRAFADVLYVMRAREIHIQKSDARFEQTLAQYRDPARRPAFPEEARRFRVQAEAAVQEKRFVDAINAYVHAVLAAPWWSEGYFNLALLHGEVGDPVEAIRMMKRFLALEPRHPQARAAQDRIYVWEAKIPR
jgi:tetratricopeptide (TPR) repeat protein